MLLYNPRCAFDWLYFDFLDYFQCTQAFTSGVNSKFAAIKDLPLELGSKYRPIKTIIAVVENFRAVTQTLLEVKEGA